MRLRTLHLVAGLLSLVSFLTLHGANRPPGPTRAQTELRYLVQMLQYFHPRHDQVNAKDVPQVIELLLKRLDPDQVCFTKQDLEQLRAKYAPELADRITFMSDMASAVAAYEIFRERMDARTAWILERLKAGKDLAQPTPTPSGSHQSWLSPGELDRYWEQRLRHEWALEVARGATEVEAADRVRQHHQAVAANTTRSADEIATLFTNSYVALYDPDSTYLSGAELGSFNSAPAGTVGIAASFSSEGSACVFESVTPGGSADLAGIAPGDRLLAVEPAGGERVDVAGLDLRQITELIRGPADTPVKLVVERPYSLAANRLTLTRQRAPEPRVQAYRALDFPTENRGRKMGVIRVPSLYPAMPAPDGNPLPAVSLDVQAALAAFDAAGVEGVVLDLRGNGGGALSEAVQVAGLFVGNEVIARETVSGKSRIDPAVNITNVYRKPLVVLVDAGTASGAELIAGALQDYSRAAVVGAGYAAQGVGSTQAVLELKKFLPKPPPDTGALRLTVGYFYLPRGTALEGGGIKPDLLLPVPHFRSDAPQAKPARAAIAAIAPLPLIQDPTRDGQLAKLKKKSEHRLGTLPDLRHLQRWSEETGQPPGPLPQDPAALRQWIQDRTANQERYRTESAAFAADAPRLESVPLREAVPSSGKNVPDDLVLRETLRILADAIELAPASSPPSG